MKQLLFVIAFGLTMLISGCSTTSGLSPKESHSGFDDASTVTIAPHGNVPSSSFNMIGTGLGAEWNQARKDEVILIVAVINQTTGISGAELNIDGEKMTLEAAPGVTDLQSGGDIMKISTRAFVTRLDVIEKIIRSKRTWLRVHTPTGSLENAVIDGAKDSKAYHALKRFFESVRLKLN